MLLWSNLNHALTYLVDHLCDGSGVPPDMLATDLDEESRMILIIHINQMTPVLCLMISSWTIHLIFHRNHHLLYLHRTDQVRPELEQSHCLII